MNTIEIFSYQCKYLNPDLHWFIFSVRIAWNNTVATCSAVVTAWEQNYQSVYDSSVDVRIPAKSSRCQ